MAVELQLPTDNFYKFLSVIFLILWCCSWVAPEYYSAQMNLEKVKLKQSINVHDDQQDILKSQISAVEALINIHTTMIESKNSDIQKTIEDIDRRALEKYAELDRDKEMKKRDEHYADVQELMAQSRSNLELIEKLLHKNAELVKLNSENKVRVEKLKLYGHWLNLLESWAFGLRIILGVLTFIFMGLWLKWQRRADRQMFQVQ
ncbi:hypothetical protein ACNHUJ_004636 [Vibrio vulnificus]|nr:hypothetical protein [Vibrio vulnificus]